jgi:DNA-binding CsgD family transcriptional regulator
LNRKEIAAHNSKGGLNLVVTHYGIEQRPMQEFIALNGKFIESFFYLHSGYQIKEFLTENFTPEDTAITLSHSLFIRRTYPEYVPGNKPSFPHTLVGARREEFNDREKMFAFALLLHSQPSRFGFSQGEKDVLERALLGETDQEIARSLHFTVWAVKKRWQGIYEKVENTNTSLFTPKDTGSEEENQKVERRRLLLDYLRTHLEEIRPTLKVLKKRK